MNESTKGEPWGKSNLIMYTIIGNDKESIQPAEHKEGMGT